MGLDRPGHPACPRLIVLPFASPSRDGGPERPSRRSPGGVRPGRQHPPRRRPRRDARHRVANQSEARTTARSSGRVCQEGWTRISRTTTPPGRAFDRNSTMCAPALRSTSGPRISPRESRRLPQRGHRRRLPAGRRSRPRPLAPSALGRAARRPGRSASMPLALAIGRLR